MEASKPDYPKIPDQEYQKPDSGIIHIIKFQLPEHQEELDIHMRAWKYRAALEDLQQWIRSMQKHGIQDAVTVDELAEKFTTVINDNEAWIF